MSNGTTTPEEHDHIALVYAEVEGQDSLALLVKQTLVIGEDGRCEPTEPAEPIFDDSYPYEELEAPHVSPPRCDNDHFAFKRAADLIVQGNAQTYGTPLRETVVEVGLRGFARQIRVFGDRFCSVTAGGRLTFTDPELFETMPIRYDRAYGGFDRIGLERRGDWLADSFRDVRPEWGLDANTPFHYPRNPAGKGFLVSADRDSAEGVPAPNLDFPFDPVTPERMAVGDPLRWPTAPVPASFDWQHQAWFPRIAHLGVVPEHASGSVFQEVEWRWCSAGILSQDSILQLHYDPGFLQAASAGLVVADLGPGERLRFRNLFPQRPEMEIHLPGLVPRVTLYPKWRGPLPTTPHLNSLVVRPDEGLAVLVWSARTPVHRRFAGPELESTPFELVWERENRGALP